MSKLELCPCTTWARTNQTLLSGHHQRCEHYNPEADAVALIAPLLEGIERWAADEDGIPEHIWEAYGRARAAIGRGWPKENTDG
jgi:hypothetical protein